jgi:hypothetical protein
MLKFSMNIKKIVESAILAPSGDNCQPWRLVIKNNQINIFNLPWKDTSLFNFRQRASLVAHGALIENILLASSANGYNAKLRYFPDKINSDLVAIVELESSDVKSEPLYPYIASRSTNRKTYRPIPLTVEQRIGLLKTSADLITGEVRLSEESQEKAVLAEAIGINDRLVFENQNLHRFLFEHIRWNEEEAQKTRDGLHIKTLELTPPQTIGFRLLKNWSLLQTLNKFGLSRVIAKQAERLCLSASAIGTIIVDKNTDEDFLTGGRLLQRVWLEATKMGLSFQPMTGITFLIQKVMTGDNKDISYTHIKLIKDAYERIKAGFRLRNETIVVLFRIGRSDPPGGRSLRLPVDRVVKIN